MKLTVEIFIRIIIAVLLVFSVIHFMTPMFAAIVNIGNITGVAVSVILFFMWYSVAHLHKFSAVWRPIRAGGFSCLQQGELRV